MTLTIPLLAVVVFVVALPFLVGLLVAWMEGPQEFMGWPAPSLLAPLAFVVTAAVCWTALLVWWWMR